MNLIYRYYNIKDEVDIIDLRKKLHEIVVSDKNSINYWKHENILNPSGKSVIALCYDDNKLVSQFVLLPKKIKFFQHIVTSYQSLEVMTDKNYRRKGIFTKLGNMAQEKALQNNSPLLWAFPNQNSINGFLYKFNWTHIASVPVLVRPLDAAGVIFPKPLSNLLNIFTQNIYDLFYLKSDFTLEDFDSFDDSFNSLLQKFNDSFNIILKRSVSALNWRYLNVPNRVYKKYLFRQNNVVKGFVVYRITEFNNKRIAVLMDAFSDDKNNFVKFVNSTLTKLKNNENCKLVFAMIPKHTSQYSVLRKSGFIRLPEKFNPYKFNLTGNVTEKFTFQQPDEFYNFNNWYICFGDNDVF